ncbi:MAG: UvrD-helicase domain-containing protein, partial [Geobacteraceae bacterium]
MRWSQVKQELFRFESNIVVSAGAGSGKTAALVELYLRLLDGKTALERPLATEEIVAITFTDKAAVEMKERVRREIRKRLASGDGKIGWEGKLHSLSFAPIATFHSFCARLLRENPVEAGIDPAFNLLDEMTASAEMEGSLDELLEAELKTRSPALRLLLGRFPFSGMGRGKGVREHLRDLYHRQTLGGRGYADMATMNNDWAVEAGRRFAVGVTALPGLVAEVERTLAGKPLIFHEALKRLPMLYRRGMPGLDNAATPEFLRDLQVCISGNWGKEKPLRDQLTACLEELQMACCQSLSRPLVETLLHLTERLADTYRQRKERRGALDFEALQVKARDLLANNVRVREECRQRFAVVMVDEFQDTNPLQKELVSLLCGPNQRLFIVGDPKQSIYRFRGADVTVFAKARAEAAATGGKTLYFQESFRSREGIIAFVNSLFSQVMREEEEDGLGYGPDDHLEPERRDWDGAPCVELMTIPAENGAGGQRELEAAAVAARIRRLVDGAEGVEIYDRSSTNTGSHALETAFTKRKPRFGDIAILFRRFSNLKLFERELRKADIPYYVVKGRGFYRCQEVLDILNFLRYLEYKGDLTALVGVLRSPLCGVSDETLYLLAQAEDGLGRWEKCFTRSPIPDPRSPILARLDPEDHERLASLARLLARLRP